jgi:hypothetical protein
MENSTSKVVSLRLKPELAQAFKVEAAKRNMKLVHLFEEMLADYKNKQENGSDKDNVL